MISQVDIEKIKKIINNPNTGYSDRTLRLLTDAAEQMKVELYQANKRRAA